MAVDEYLSRVEDLVSAVELEDAQGLLTQFIASLTPSELERHRDRIERTISQFLPKRRRELTRLLETRAGGAVAPSTPDSIEQVASLETRIRATLSELGQRHSFQWATFYRDAVHELIDLVVQSGFTTNSADGQGLLGTLREEFFSHTKAVFQRAADADPGRTPEVALTQGAAKSALSRFLELPVEALGVKAAQKIDRQTLLMASASASCMVAGIIEGFAELEITEWFGRDLLCNNADVWVPALCFVRQEELGAVLASVSQCAIAPALNNRLSPLSIALETLNQGETNPLVPINAAYSNSKTELTARFEVFGAQTTQRPLDIRIDLSPNGTSTRKIEDAHNELVSLYICDLPEDLVGWLSARPSLSRIVVNVSTVAASPMQPIYNELVRGLRKRLGTAIGTLPFTWNVAKEFPLNSPFISKYYRVQRRSVRDLFARSANINGVRLWCSVRRSGKTTACFDLESHAANSVVLTQTCTRTNQFVESNAFFDSVTEALERAAPIPSTFLEAFVASQRGPFPAGRTVLLIDEYETLFHRLHYASVRSPELQYTIVQPLLDQMVGFSQENLLVFVGQWPDAHYLAMDQNQLSAYVEQDHFPLFDHVPGRGYGEYWDFLGKVFRSAVTLETRFADVLHRETGGHPFLTVQLSIDFLDWVIRHQRPTGTPTLDVDYFSEFASTQLAMRAVASSSSYQYFRNVVSEALSDVGRERTPWLHAVYSILKQIALDFPEELSCTRGEFELMCRNMRLVERIGYDGSTLLSSAEMSNFFRSDQQRVYPAVRLLARIAAGAQPRRVW